MDVFPGLIGETEFANFIPEDYVALGYVLDDVLAKYLRDYISNSDADDEIVSNISKYIGPVIESLTFHYTLKEMGITDMISRLSPENLISANVDHKDIQEKLKFLEDNIHKLRTVIDSRSKTQFENFMSAMRALDARMRSQGITPTYYNWIDGIISNKFLFYVPNDKGHTTGTGVITSRRRQWTMCLRGLEFKEYCDAKNIPYITRRAF